MNKFLLLSILLLNSITGISQSSDTTIISNDNSIYEIVDSIAKFPGDKPAWNKFVAYNFDATVGIENGAKKGTYKIKVRFTVTKEGILKDFEPISNYKHGLEEEAISMLKRSPKWIPAKKNGVNVNSKVEQEVVFIISKG